METPSFIQRCKLGEGRLRYDYMGSVEFEGHVKSLKRIFTRGIRSGSCVVDVGDKKVVVFMVAGSGFVFDDYQSFLQQFVDNTLHLQRSSYFSETVRAQVGINPNQVYVPILGPQVNAWFDPENDVLWTLTRDNLELLVSTMMGIKSKWSEEKR